ncbi:MAG: hypothetical protein HLX51_06165 [Micrococcaceae bacterium]|nr:hypothetical protein [Micrococcaceae bacterium]
MDNLSLASLVWLAGTVLFAVSLQQMRRANPDEKIPQFFGRPRNHPGEIYVYRAIALFLLLASSLAWAERLGFWSFLLVIAGATPAVMLNVQHNRRVQAEQPKVNG